MYDEIEFEGEYINGERIGIIKKYHYDGKLEFECGYKNDKRNGYGKKYKIIMENYYLKVNIKMMKKMDLGKNMMGMKI